MTLLGNTDRLEAGTEDAAAKVAASYRSHLRNGLGGAAGIVLPALLLAGWWSLSALGVFAPNLVPSPPAVLDEIAVLAANGDLLTHIGVTLYRVALGFLWGTLAATVFGVATGYSPVLRAYIDPSLQALKAVPSLAWVPLFILWFGIFEASKITLIAVGVFFPVYLNLMSAVQDTDRKLVEVGRIYRLTTWQLIRRILVPATIPSYVVGLRGGLALGWMFVIAAELMGASEGLGFLMIDGQMTGRPAVIVASLLLFAVFGKLSDLALALAARPFLGWQDAFGGMNRNSRNA
jgi:sulfonate transport system permease protein